MISLHHIFNMASLGLKKMYFHEISALNMALVFCVTYCSEIPTENGLVSWVDCLSYDRWYGHSCSQFYFSSVMLCITELIGMANVMS